MKRRAFVGMGLIGFVGAGTCSWWAGKPAPRIERVSLTSQQARRLVPADVGTELWAVLRVQVDEGALDDRPPIDVALVIDTSASMDGAPIEAARAAAAELVSSLRDGDRLTVVTFDSRARLAVPSVEIDDDARERCHQALAEIEARGTTDLAAGLHQALGDLCPHAAEGRVSRVVLLSDGVPNDASSIPSAISQASAAGITVTALGLGLDYDETLLASIAQQTGGRFHFLESPTELVPLFREENRRLMGVEARQLVLTLTTGPRVELREVVGHTAALPQPRLSLGLGDLSQGEERVVVVRLAVGPHRAGATVELLDAQLTYRDPRTGETVEHDGVFLSARAEDDRAVLADSVDPEVEREIESAKAAALTLQAVALARQGEATRARDVLNYAVPAAAEAAQRLDDRGLARQVEDLEALADVLGEAEADEPVPRPEAAPAARSLSNAAPTVAPDPASKAGQRRRQVVRRAHGHAMSNFQARRNRL